MTTIRDVDAKYAADKHVTLTPRQLALKTLTTNQVAAVFGVSIVTISVWRKGTSTRDQLQTCHNEDETRFPKFRVSEINRYAKKHGLKFERDPEAVLNNWVSVKPGPKPKSLDPEAPTRTDAHGNKSTMNFKGTAADKSSKSAKKKPKH